MLSVFDGRPGFSRREFLRIGSLGLGGLSLPQLLGARALAENRRGPSPFVESAEQKGTVPFSAGGSHSGSKSITRGKSVIFLYLFGGPSQFETFDPKMSAPVGIRSVNGEVATSLPGVTFG
jgi:hypothetical protein